MPPTLLVSLHADARTMRGIISPNAVMPSPADFYATSLHATSGIIADAFISALSIKAHQSSRTFIELSRPHACARATAVFASLREHKKAAACGYISPSASTVTAMPLHFTELL